MRVADKLALLDRIGRELQGRFTFGEIDAFLTEYKLPLPDKSQISFNSKRLYAVAALRGVPIETVLRIADELDVDITLGSRAAAVPPRNWQDTTRFKLFISHISKDKDKATRLKECLQEFAISGFVAHEDIHPTLVWQTEIERALYAMDALLTIHTEGFSKSHWTQQEIGFALGRGVKIISFKMGEDPTGFIAREQALPRRRRTAEEIAKEIADLLAADEVTKERLTAAQSTEVSKNIPF